MNKFDLLEKLQEENSKLDKEWKVAFDACDRTAVIAKREMLWKIINIINDDEVEIWKRQN